MKLAVPKFVQRLVGFGDVLRASQPKHRQWAETQEEADALNKRAGRKYRPVDEPGGQEAGARPGEFKEITVPKFADESRVKGYQRTTTTLRRLTPIEKLARAAKDTGQEAVLAACGYYADAFHAAGYDAGFEPRFEGGGGGGHNGTEWRTLSIVENTEIAREQVREARRYIPTAHRDAFDAVVVYNRPIGEVARQYHWNLKRTAGEARLKREIIYCASLLYVGIAHRLNAIGRPTGITGESSPLSVMSDEWLEPPQPIEKKAVKCR
jgi:hypothetical protein